MKKTYVSIKTVNLSVSVVDKNGVSRQITFEGGVVSPFRKYARYTTSDAMEQWALEKSPAFNNFYALESLENPKPEPNVVDEPVHVEGVKTLAEARDYLLSMDENLTASDLKNKKDVIEEAGKRGITFDL